ncbi:hypothetical protein P5673_012894 [Acropora cervicornis]|uniref:Uncharacterized protein n=1 Tax=Acropora cervicornis TaxID=6130 RepID=A0AAD9QMX3_ACRCE|nr:hypothetical protein P5673_012894 [Acropora cervicornis]
MDEKAGPERQLPTPGDGVKIIGTCLLFFLKLERFPVDAVDFKDSAPFAALRYSELISPKIIG